MRSSIFNGEISMQRRPFHQTIIDTIARVPVYNLPILAELIRETRIPHGHDQIIEAWQKKTAGLMLDEGGFGFDVVADILAQKQESRRRHDEEISREYEQLLREENGVIPSAY